MGRKRTRTREDVRAYQAAYYQDHKAEIAARKARRYAEDPAYKRGLRESAGRAREVQRAVARILRGAGLLHRERTDAIQLALPDGGVVTAYPLRVAAAAVGRSVETLDYWERHGCIPRTPYRGPRGERVYTADQVAVLELVLGRRPIVRRADHAVAEAVAAGWQLAEVARAAGAALPMGALVALLDRVLGPHEND